MLVSVFAGPSGLFAQEIDWSEGEEFLYRDRPQEAVRALRPLVANNSKEPYGYYLLGTAEFESGDFNAAEEMFTKGIETKGRYALNHVGIARVLIQQNKVDEAMEILERALYFDKGKDINVKFAVAKAYLDAGKLKDAEVLLRQAQTEATDDPRSYVMLGDYEYNRGVFEFAMQQYTKAIEIDPKYIPAYTRIGELKIEQAKGMQVEEDDEDGKKQRTDLYNEGLKYLNQAIQEDPNYAPSYQVRGDLMMLAGNYEQGREDYKKYLQLQQNDLKAELNYGKFLFLSENYQDAIDQFEKIDTVTGVKLRLLGMSYQQLGQLDKAQEYMDKYFELKSEEFRISDDYETYAEIFLDKRELAKADEYFEKAIAMKPSRSVIWEEKAEEFSRKALRLKRDVRSMENDLKDIVDKANSLAEEGNSLNESGDIDGAKAKYEAREKAMEDYKELKTDIAKEEAKLPELYQIEAHYREKAKENADPVGLQEIMKYGMALYSLADLTDDKDLFEKADKEFKEAHGLMDNYDRPYIYRYQIALKIEKIDSTLKGQMMAPVVEDALGVWGEKDIADLSAKEKAVMVIAYAYKAFLEFTENENDCDAAKPYIEKTKAIKPNYPTIQGIVEYCESLQQSGKR